MDRKNDGGKFGLEIPALTEARIQAETNSYCSKSRENYQSVMDKNVALIQKVWGFLEKNGAITASTCGAGSIFGIITSEEDPKAPCGIVFYGSGGLAQALADTFPAYKVIASYDGKVITPSAATLPKQIKRKPSSGPKF